MQQEQQRLKKRKIYSVDGRNTAKLQASVRRCQMFVSDILTSTAVKVKEFSTNIFVRIARNMKEKDFIRRNSKVIVVCLACWLTLGLVGYYVQRSGANRAREEIRAAGPLGLILLSPTWAWFAVSAYFPWMTTGACSIFPRSFMIPTVQLYTTALIASPLPIFPNGVWFVSADRQ